MKISRMQGQWFFQNRAGSQQFLVGSIVFGFSRPAATTTRIYLSLKSLWGRGGINVLHDFLLLLCIINFFKIYVPSGPPTIVLPRYLVWHNTEKNYIIEVSSSHLYGKCHIIVVLLRE